MKGKAPTNEPSGAYTDVSRDELSEQGYRIKHSIDGRLTKTHLTVASHTDSLIVSLFVMKNDGIMTVIC